MSDSSQLQLAWQRMVTLQLQRRGITSRRVVAAMSRVPRHRFVPLECGQEAYADRALAIDCEQTISQPYIVALMTQALALQGTERVLEVGTGSGYQTAILAELASEVVSIERHEQLSRQAAAILGELGYRNVHLIIGDGSQGWPQRAPYDRIIVTAGAQTVPQTLFDQLVEGGTLVMPLGEYDSQTLQSVRKIHGQMQMIELCGCRFVPLVTAPSSDWSHSNEPPKD